MTPSVTHRTIRATIDIEIKQEEGKALVIAGISLKEQEEIRVSIERSEEAEKARADAFEEAAKIAGEQFGCLGVAAIIRARAKEPK